uniref:Uncharacterized protein n=1 Tax=Arundo donax TaxID=35708 RepID=A0A0A9FVZ3_ARUDO
MVPMETPQQLRLRGGCSKRDRDTACHQGGGSPVVLCRGKGATGSPTLIALVGVWSFFYLDVAQM